MTTITIQLPAETTEKLRRQADQLGKSLEDYVRDLARERAGADDHVESLSLAELERRLDELIAGLPELPRLPDDFSRTDVYAEHD